MGFIKTALGLLLFLVAGAAVAQTYTLSGNGNNWDVPPGCTAKNNTNVTCDGLVLQADDTIITDGKTIIEVTGDVNLNGASILVGSSGVPLTIIASGNITTGFQFSGTVNFSATGNISLGYQNTITGNLDAAQITTGGLSQITGTLTGTQITTSYQDTIDGSLNASDSIDINGQNNITGAITGTNSIVLRADNSTFGGPITSSGAISIGSGHVIDGNISGTDVTTDSPVTITGNVTATGTFTLASGSSMDGNVSAENVLILASNSNIQGTVNATQDIIIGNGSGITGNASADFIQLEASNAYITGNATATTEIQIDWQGTISGDVSAPTVENNGGSVGGTTYCDAGAGSTPPECDPSSPPPPDSCSLFNDLADFGIVGSNGFNAGGGSQINDNDIVDETGTGGNTPTPAGTIDTVDLEFPPLEPATFPVFTGSGTEQNATNLAPGTYGTIRTQGNNAVSSTAGGGNYYIEEITFSTNSNTLNLAPGDYFIKSMDLGNNSSINIVPDGPVRLFIRDGVFGGNDISFNSTGNVGNLVVYLYEGADFVIGNYCNSGNNCPEFTFNGLIYSPYETTDINFGNNTNFQGGALTAGTVTLGSNANISYTPAVQNEVNQAAGCTPEPAAVDHFRILHPQRQVSCLAAAVDIIACANSDCTETYDDTVTFTATASVSGSTWQGSSVVSATAESSNWEFLNGTGNASLRNVSGGVTAISLASAVPTATEPVQCYDPSGVTPTSCAIDFVAAGLAITAADGVSNVPSDFAGNDFTLALRAVETNTTTGACMARVEGAQSVDFGLECTNPLTCQAGQNFSLNNASIPLNNNGTAITTSPISVSFDNTGTALLTANYTDVGQLRLHAELDLAEDVGNGDPDVTLTGTSINDFVVRPHTLVTAALDDLENIWVATTDTGAGFTAAGEPFTLIVQSLNANGNPTPNFGQEVITADVLAEFDSMAYPIPADPSSNASKLTITNPFTVDPTYSGAKRTTGAVWREAGTVNLRARLGGDSYLGAGDAFSRLVSPIGRFYPDRFVLSSSSVSDSCSTGNFSYMGQPTIGVAYTIDAVNTAGVLTRNYNSASYLGTAEFELVAAHTMPQDTVGDEFSTRLVAPITSTWVAGQYTVPTTPSVQFNRRLDEAADGPYPNLRLGLRVLTEQDARAFASASLITQSGNATALNGTLDLRYGRMVLENTFGPEDEPLPVVMRSEYFDGQRFILHGDDSCTATTPTALNIIDNPNALATSGEGIDSDLLQGELQLGNLLWSAPTPPNNTGEFLFEYQTDSWLEYPWLDEDGDGHRFPQATAGFGQYRGNDRVIFWMERVGN